MKVACKNCGTSFVVDETQLPPSGVDLTCSTCSSRFKVTPGAADPTKSPLGVGDDDYDAVIELPSPLITPPPAASSGPAGGRYAPLVDSDSDLPAPVGAVRRPPAITDLPLAGDGRFQPTGEVVDLPAPRVSSGPKAPAVPPPIVDLPGLVRRQVEHPPALGERGRTIQGRPPPLESLPPARGFASQPPAVPDDLPAPKGAKLDLSDFDVPAKTAAPGLEEMNLPAPKGIVDLPVPATIVDLPTPAARGRSAPRAIVDLPAPSPNVDLPAPQRATGMNYGDVALDQDGQSAGLDFDDLPLPPDLGPIAGQPSPRLDAELPSGTIDLPRPAGPGRKGAAAGGGFDVPMPLHGEEDAGDIELPAGIIDLPRPVKDEPVSPAAVLAPVAGAAGKGLDRIAGTSPRGGGPLERIRREWLARVPRRVVIGAGGVAFVLFAGVLVGLVTDYGYFGVNLVLGGPSGVNKQSAREVAEGQRLFNDDSYASYLAAAKKFEAGALGLEEEEVIVPRALQAQASLAAIVRFGADQERLTAVETLLNMLPELEQPPLELLKARALLQLAKDGKSETLSALAAQHSKDVRLAVYSAWGMLHAREFPKAIPELRRALELEPKLAAALFGLAQVGASLGKADEARRWLDQLLQVNPQHASGLLLQARLLLGDKEGEKARLLLERILTITTADAEKSSAQAFLGDLAAERGEVNAAREHYDAALALDAKNIAAQIGLGRQLLHAKQPTQALEKFRQARASAPDNVEAALLLAEAELALDRHLNARKALQEVLQTAPRDARVHAALARVEEGVGQMDAAIKGYNTAIELDPRHLPGYVALSKIYIKQKRESEAFAALKQAATLIEGAPVRNALGEAHLELGQLSEAQARFEEALSIDPQMNVALFNLANAYRLQDKSSEALEKYRELEKRDANYPELAANVGLLYLKMGEPGKAASSYDQALKIDRPSTRLRLAAGEAFLAAAQPDKALEQADAVLKEVERETMGDGLALRARARMDMNELGEALVEIQRAAEREERSEFYEIQARIQERLKRPLDALDSLAKAIKLAPKRVDLRFERARILVRAGTVKDGLAELKEVIRENPELASAYLFKGIAHADLGDKDAATSSFREALQRDPKLGEAHFRLAQVLLDKEQLPQAHQHLQQAVEHGQKDERWKAEATYLLGQVAMRRDLRKEAVDAFRLFLEIARPEDASRVEAKKALAQLGAPP